jgi:PAS domain S-box-containing protein
MAQNPVKVGSRSRLRREAEARVSLPKRAAEPTGKNDALRLLHELEVHRIELEMQNEELRRAQHELEDSRDRYWALYDQAPVGYLTLDAGGYILEANLTAASMLDLERGSMIGLPLASFMTPADARVFERHRQEVFRREIKQGCDVWIRRRAGAAFPAHFDSIAWTKPGRGPAGTGPTVCRTVLFDLSELRETQEALRTQKWHTQTLLDTAADAIVNTDDQGGIESINAAAERLFGYADSDVRARSIRLLMPDPTLEAHVGQPSRETTGVKKDGTICPLEISVGEWRDQGARKLTAIIRDVSARKRAEQQLIESETRFRQIAEYVEDVFYVRERSGLLSYVSPGYERIWGRPVASLAGNPAAWLDTIDPGDQQRVADAWARMRDGEPFSEIYRIWRPDGTKRWVHSRGFAVQGLDGEHLRNVGVVRDITIERQLEEDLRHSQKMEAVGTLASGMAHNLRNVLQAVLAFIHVAQKSGHDRERAANALARAFATAKRGSTLTDQLMAFSRKEETNAKPVPVDAAVREAGELLQSLVGGPVVVKLDCRAPNAVIMSEPMVLEQILLNLGTNARDAMPTGGFLTISTEEAVLDEQAAQTHGVAKGPHAKVIVRDTGSGMSAATRARIFEPFFTTKEVGKGTGLGLSTVFALTRQAGGRIEVDSQIGKGTTFTVSFPSVQGQT